MRRRRQRVVPPEAFLKLFLGCYPITACSPSARGAPNLKGYALCRRPPVNMQLVTGRTFIDNTKTGMIWEAWELHFDILRVQLGSRALLFDAPEVSRNAQQDTLESRPG